MYIYIHVYMYTCIYIYKCIFIITIYIYIRMYVCIYIELMNLHCMTSNQSTLMAHSSTSEFSSSSPSSWPCSAWTPLECVMPTCKRPTMPCKVA